MKRSTIISMGMVGLAVLTLTGCGGTHTSPPMIPTPKTSVSSTPTASADAKMNADLADYYAKCGLTKVSDTYQTTTANSKEAKQRTVDDCPNVLNLRRFVDANSETPEEPTTVTWTITELPQKFAFDKIANQNQIVVKLHYAITFKNASDNQEGDTAWEVYYNTKNKVALGNQKVGDPDLSTWSKSDALLF